MSDTRVGRPAEIAGPGLALWEAARESDVRGADSLDRGPSRGTAGEAIRDVKRVSEALGPVGFAWGWEVKSERLDTFGLGEEQRVIHSCVLRAWFRRPDGSKGHLEHVGHTKAAYWTRARRPGDKPRYVIDEEFAKKSVTDALSKIMVNLGASADIWLGRFDGNKYVAPSAEEQGRAAGGDAAKAEERLVAHAREILAEVKKAKTKDAVVEVARKIKGTFDEQPFWPQLVATDRDLAAEIQQLVRGKAQPFELDLSRV